MQTLEHDLEHKERHLAIEWVARSDLEAEVAQKEQLASNHLEAKMRSYSALFVVVEKL